MREIFVEKSYAGQSVLVTGATGFIGKVLVEKLLRECKDIKKIYMLLRSKKGDGLEKRFENFKNLIVFNDLRRKDPKILDKLSAIEGDLMEANSGISKRDEEFLINNLTCIIHCAASVRFDEPLKVALQMNTISTRNMLNLAEKCVNFKAFVHVSTAYSNTDKDLIDEVIYEPICDVNEAIALVENNREEELKEMEEFACKTYPNTYVFTKNLSEKLVSSYTHLPITIVRPSIVCPSYKEPYIGWVRKK
jgi:fatty acyl-CoA reductase